MQDRYLWCPPYFFLGPAVAHHFFYSRIATAYKLEIFTLSSLGKVLCWGRCWSTKQDKVFCNRKHCTRLPII